MAHELPIPKKHINIFGSMSTAAIAAATIGLFCLNVYQSKEV
jgi:hypothetical protein